MLIIAFLLSNAHMLNVIHCLIVWHDYLLWVIYHSVCTFNVLCLLCVRACTVINMHGYPELISCPDIVISDSITEVIVMVN